MSTNQQQQMEQWESDFLRTGDDSLIPEEDRERVFHELDALCEELHTLLRMTEKNPGV